MNIYLYLRYIYCTHLYWGRTLRIQTSKHCILLINHPFRIEGSDQHGFDFRFFQARFYWWWVFWASTNCTLSLCTQGKVSLLKCKWSLVFQAISLFFKATTLIYSVVAFYFKRFRLVTSVIAFYLERCRLVTSAIAFYLKPCRFRYKPRRFSP